MNILDIKVINNCRYDDLIHHYCKADDQFKINFDQWLIDDLNKGSTLVFSEQTNIELDFLSLIKNDREQKLILLRVYIIEVYSHLQAERIRDIKRAPLLQYYNALIEQYGLNDQLGAIENLSDLERTKDKSDQCIHAICELKAFIELWEYMDEQ